MNASEPVYLDPDYCDFVPGRSKLKASTFYGNGCLNNLMAGLKLLLLFLTTVLIIWLAQGSVVSVWHFIRLTTSSVTTQAEIVSCKIRSNRGGTYPFVRYRYTVDGDTYNGQTLYEI